jgi:hypothetical protein
MELPALIRILTACHCWQVTPMLNSPDSGSARSRDARAYPSGLNARGGDWAEPSQPERDVKKLVLMFGLGILSWVATYVGMLELIESNLGDLPIVHKIIIAFSVAMLMTMIIWLLDQMFSPIGTFTRLCYIGGYCFLSLISIGFGFGFYWKVLESRAESSRSAESAVAAVQGSLNAASTRLQQLDATLSQLAVVSREKAELERTKGTSCPNSSPGDGPRRRMRDEDAQRFSFASDFVKGRIGTVKSDIAALDGDLARIAGTGASTIDAKTGTRNKFMKALSRKLDMTVTGFNALRTDPQLNQIRGDLSERAGKTTFGDPRKGGFICPDAQLAQALRGAVRAIDQLPILQKPEIAAVEGSEATIEAFRRLTATFYGVLSFKMPPSADELRDMQRKAVQSVQNGPAVVASKEGSGLSTRDYIPLAIAIFVDLCLLLVSMGRRSNRLHGLVPKMRDAEEGPVIEILSRFNDIHRDQRVRESFELFRHVVFDVHGAYYVAVPLDAPPRLNSAERESLRVEAQLLANLFTSFEKDRIFKRTWAPFSGTIRKKLRRQGSKFAESEAFRVYRFRDGAWSEIILGAVMGAARRAESAEQQSAIEEPSLNAPPRVSPVHRREDFAVGPARSEGSPVLDFPAPRDRPFAQRTVHEDDSRETADAKSVAQFGVYARGAKAELSGTRRALHDSASAANSNTAPATLPTAEDAMGSVEAHPSDNAKVVEFPRESVDVVLKRETARVSLPAGNPEQTDALVGRLGEALARIETKLADPDTPSAEDGEATTNAESSLPEIVFLPSAEIEIDEDSDPEDDLATDEATADAAAIAGRLRPAIARD